MKSFHRFWLMCFCLGFLTFPMLVLAEPKPKFPEPVNQNCNEQKVDSEGYSYRGSDLAGPDLAAIKEAARILKTSHPALSEKLSLVAARHQ
ncbi:MAG: hypothetical protein COV74_08140 [Candidatus Omnitrophica bacterium CG11_big_fil_rev_8_21_14_0_20_45_26]|uniref:Uncharacterized protein n=1 Tax=Candidatus Abzuiibacterium crystallinum TaxID=1974748 RepID=A0A2H0LMR7_9BACT|nr:MAG: hypothetical protein COV74_08140 [Candidatus Omnitrophica bacterium CG11_big_fil_rev_8_21_14_0_20_45_26]PIW65189.1 MAG: hypothetical protein COW12_03180 [Candidatus Omnitrophica bacterium CG12_big_fil_rev_8_21_14_0_65_45_16]